MLREYRTYKTKELETLLSGFRLHTPLFELESQLDRSGLGIFHKMRILSKKDPETWNPNKVREYRRELWEQYKRDLWRQWYYERGGKEKVMRYYQTHWGKVREQQRLYREQNREKIRKMKQEWNRINKEKKKKEWRQWYYQNKRRWQRFGNVLATLISEYNGSKSECARELGTSLSSLLHYSAGNKKPPEKFLKKVSERFDVSYQTLQDLLI